MDWRISEQVEKAQIGDDRQYTVNVNLSNQSRFDIFDNKGEPCFGMIVEINHGVPAVHLDIDGGDSTLHIHAVNGGLVLTPDEKDRIFESAEINRYSYNDQSSLFIR